MAVAGLLLTLLLLARGVRAALLLGIVGTTVLAIVVNAARAGGGVWTTPGRGGGADVQLVAWPDFSTLGAGAQPRGLRAAGLLGAALAIFSIMLSDFFDTVGTVIGIGGRGAVARQGRAASRG